MFLDIIIYVSNLMEVLGLIYYDFFTVICVTQFTQKMWSEINEIY